ncbi:MAG: hypothetical protein JXR07_13395 [Reichenbachiella sp.]
MNELPAYIGLVFIATTIATVGFIYFGIQSTEKKKENKVALTVLIVICTWLALTGFLAYNGFYRNYEAIPPRLVFVFGPTLLSTFILLLIKKSRAFLLKVPITTLTYLHIVRVPVEMVLWWLALNKALPLMLTFEGINHDILSGVSAPFVAIFLVGINRYHRITAIIWNFVALGLLFNIVGHALLSAPTPFQKFSFEQPMIAVFYLPYIWLPAFIVPAVFFSHLVSLMQLFSNQKER